MLSKLSVATGVIILLVCYTIYLRECSRPAPCPDGDRIRIDTEYITVSSQPITDTIYQPGDTIYKTVKTTIPGKDSIVFVEIVKPVPAKIDTQAVIQAYYAMVIQQDSLKTDDLKIRITDTITKNRIVGRRWDVAQTKSTPRIKRQFYFGGGFHTSLFMNKGLSSEAISTGHIDLGYINRKGQHMKLDLMRTGGRWHQGISFYHTFGK